MLRLNVKREFCMDAFQCVFQCTFQCITGVTGQGKTGVGNNKIFKKILVSERFICQ